MRQYKITAYVGLKSYSKVIEARNSVEANELALSYGHKLSQYGSGSFLRGVKVMAISVKKNRFS